MNKPDSELGWNLRILAIGLAVMLLLAATRGCQLRLQYHIDSRPFSAETSR